jgi:tRNA nucleotidyltransferase/poly(A) polymerase
MKIKKYIEYIKEDITTERRIKFHIDIPRDILDIKRIFSQNNKELYLVGGCVRDALLNKTPKDFDLATNANPDEVESILNRNGYTSVSIGKAFGVIVAITNNDEYEIATFRTDSTESDGRRPNSVTFSDIKSDALRRDLTLNALYYDIDKSEIIDYVGGVEDIKNNIVRTVGNPSDRFEEDKLRILRAVRFAARFNCQLDIMTDKALLSNNSLEGVSTERIRDEFLKGIKSAKSVIFYLSLIKKYNLFDWIFPQLIIDKDFTEEDNTNVQIANLLKSNDSDAVRTILKKIAYSTDEINRITFLIIFLRFTPDDIYEFKKMEVSSRITKDELYKFASINDMDMDLVKKFTNFRLTISGYDMIKMGIKPGPSMGIAIRNAEIEKFKLFIQ